MRRKSSRRPLPRSKPPFDQQKANSIQATQSLPDQCLDTTQCLLFCEIRSICMLHAFFGYLVQSRADRSPSYGGIFERGVREYTLDDFYTLPLDKLDRFTCLKPSNVVIDENARDESSDDDEDEGDDDDDDDEDDDSTVVGESVEKDQQSGKKSEDLEDIVEEVETLKVSEVDKVQFSTTPLGPYAYH